MIEHLSGQELIELRMKGYCLICQRSAGVYPAHTQDAGMSRELCEECEPLARKLMRRPKFDHKAERAAGIKNLDRLLS